MKIPTIAVFVLILLSLTRCGSKEVALAPQITNLIGTWRLVQPDSSYAVTLEFAFDTANPPHDVTPFLASGKSPINDYTLRLFATIDGMMSADDLSSTKRGGTPDAMTFEQTYYKNLRAVARYELTTNNQLRLYHGGDLPRVMVYEKVK